MKRLEVEKRKHVPSHVRSYGQEDRSPEKRGDTHGDEKDRVGNPEERREDRNRDPEAGNMPPKDDGKWSPSIHHGFDSCHPLLVESEE